MFSVARSYSSGFAEFNTTRRVFIWHDDLGIVFCSERHQRAVKPHVAAAWWESVPCDSLLTSRTGITVHDKYYSISAKCIQLFVVFLCFFYYHYFFHVVKCRSRILPPLLTWGTCVGPLTCYSFQSAPSVFIKAIPAFLLGKLPNQRNSLPRFHC